MTKAIYHKTTSGGLRAQSFEVLHLSPTIMRPCHPDEDPMPSRPERLNEARDVGYWRRFTEAVRRYGF